MNKKRRDWIIDVKKGELISLQAAIYRWLKLPEAEGFGKVTMAHITHPWANGPRIIVELDDIHEGEFLKLMFYFEKRILGFRVVGVWTIKPREKLWPRANDEGA